MEIDLREFIYEPISGIMLERIKDKIRFELHEAWYKRQIEERLDRVELHLDNADVGELIINLYPKCLEQVVDFIT